ncbi:MAG: phytanoyl-CoA dioxygenase family protein [Janthinobacterium lividum]
MNSPANWTDDFLRDGFFHLPRVVNAHTISAARLQIDRNLEECYDPRRKVEYEYQSFCPDLLGTTPIENLALDPGVREKLAELLEPEEMACDNGQIAIRRARNADQPQLPVPHIDGIPTADNGMSGDELQPFTLLVGIFLSEVRSTFAGNFTVWPGSHLKLEQYFNTRGRRALREGMPRIPFGQPQQLLCKPGDAVLCHYSLAHAAAVNISDFDRYAVFFRWTHQALNPDQSPDFREAGWKHVTNIWTDWKIRPDRLAAEAHLRPSDGSFDEIELPQNTEVPKTTFPASSIASQ